MKKIVKDNTGNDILIINEKVIPLNMKNTDLVYQNIVMDYFNGKVQNKNRIFMLMKHITLKMDYIRSTKLTVIKTIKKLNIN